jgi:hypothetical protein
MVQLRTLRYAPRVAQVSATVGPEGAHVFRDIPFALPPNGDRRWQAPVEFERADAVVEPFAEPVMCPQPQSQASGQNEGKDDYLGQRGLSVPRYLCARWPKRVRALARHGLGAWWQQPDGA